MPKGESNKFVYDDSPETGKPLTTHQFYDGTQKPWVFKRVWHLEPSLTDPNTVYAGVEDAALFRSSDGGRSWQEVAALRGHGTGPQWSPGAGGSLCASCPPAPPPRPRPRFSVAPPPYLPSPRIGCPISAICARSWWVRPVTGSSAIQDIRVPRNHSVK